MQLQIHNLEIWQFVPRIWVSNANLVVCILYVTSITLQILLDKFFNAQYLKKKPMKFHNLFSFLVQGREETSNLCLQVLALALNHKRIPDGLCKDRMEQWTSSRYVWVPRTLFKFWTFQSGMRTFLGYTTAAIRYVSV